MKKIYKSSLVVAFLAVSALFSGCNTDYLEEMRSYGNYTDEIYNDYQGALGRVNFLYAALLPYSGGSTFNFTWHSTGDADDWSKSTEEYGGFSSFVDPTLILTNSTVTDYIYGENKNVSPFGRIRECNLVKEGIEAGTLSDDQKNELLGQVYFFRAWCYYRLVKIYGGIPIIDYVQNPIQGDSGGLDLVVARSTTKECIDFICSDLDKAIAMLPAGWENAATNYGRITKGAAEALQGRARLLYASPLFNRADDADRWTLAYEANKAAKETLAYSYDDPGTNGSGWAGMFSSVQSSEAVFEALYNNIEEGDYSKWNGWENSIRPANIYGGGGKTPTAQMIDIFPMADGKLPSTASTYTMLTKSSDYPYDPELFFMNRDPRFYRTFAFPGVKWTADADLSIGNTAQPLIYPYASGSKYELWSYVWYPDEDTKNADDQSGFAADGLGDNTRSVFIRKRSDDYQVNSNPLYIFEYSSNKYKRSAAPIMEMRYGEILLNFAESACGANHLSEAVAALQELRARVGYTADNNYGLDEDLGSDRAKLFSAILYERQIELAYEGKRYDDMRRWMLWDGGVGQATLNASWGLTGFGGNTCAYLGVTPLNGTRRTGVEVRVNDDYGYASKSYTSDPLDAADVVRPDALDLATDATTAGSEEIDNLAQFYKDNFTRKTTRLDGDPSYTIDFQPEYYILGFKENMQKNNTQLKQTIGWADYSNGGADGTFDPLAE
ncbi:RagB/SusD family nutrient uptake outer membrane protein [Mangrovibacterium diazotrophicum]|uniref:Putative outer membrane starch-binding protein n=1 Tax=Mangrovibacterium diazotrophicum TaxID=1261403 RepID=A0A419W4A6_9BACT|nr:RagB/SusD family nutrient uptake outer membrane protein [Mangrovibacterium diazotrophicum]RKD90277.1 putative outer membrane starch-binding protein [Mangrovibacterium diazotrophicum]